MREVLDELGVGTATVLRATDVPGRSHTGDPRGDPELAALARHHDSATVAELYAGLGERMPRGDTPFERAAEARRLADAVPHDGWARRRGH